MSEEEQKDICYEVEECSNGTYGVQGEENPIMTGAELLASLKKDQPEYEPEATIADLKAIIAKLTKPQQPKHQITKGEQAYKWRQKGKRWEWINLEVTGRSLLLAKKWAKSNNKPWPVKQ